MLIFILLAGVVVLGAICLWQRRIIRRKNLLLVRFIMEYLRYKYGNFSGTNSHS
ncbi:MAG: hypothetical protein IKQ51_06985 [Bacteroidaceae bacterium]|nr:hypothetical protein [Bacteroidaceae bacterium]MBR6170430.1 hypothetical protein [Bacteroidaceae bacterium]